MRILFICGTLEPGKDGVGDYTRRLAGALATTGNDVFLISLNDSYVTDAKAEIQNIDVAVIHTCRISSQLDDTTRFIQAKKVIDAFNPDWISLQFVIFSFHPKGLPWSIGDKLKSILGNRNVHVMFHELWVAMDQQSLFKLKVLGLIQKIIIKKILKRIHPNIIHTHTPLYKWQLNRIGYQAKILSLFGNVPLTEGYKKEQLGYRFVVFGSIHFGAPIEVFARELRSLKHSYNKTPEVVFVGRCGNERAHWEQALSAAGIANISLGEQTVEQISELLAGAAFGITSTPYILTEKSGTVAAMLEHSLPVICVAREWNVDGFDPGKESISAIYEYKPGFLQAILKSDLVQKRKLADITNQFIQSLK